MRIDGAHGKSLLIPKAMSNRFKTMGNQISIDSIPLINRILSFTLAYLVRVIIRGMYLTSYYQ
jgi:hypothetical protein